MSSSLERIQGFADAALALNTLADLDELMTEATAAFGADYYLMTHHGNFRQPRHGLVYLGNYPEEFLQISRLDGALRADPVLEACERTLGGFFWGQVGSMIPLTEKHHRRVEAVARTGLGDGFVVPIRVPGEHLGSCHFAVETGKYVPRENSAALQSVAIFGFEAARRLSSNEIVKAKLVPQLTDRQRECLVLSARGKSDVVIGQLLGLSPKTINSYMEEAKRRYGVATRSQLIVRALYSSEISFMELVN